MKTKSIIQYLGKEINTSDIEKEVKRLWAEQGNLIKDIKSLVLYVKPEEHRCYYVINDNVGGSFELDV